MKTDGRAVIRAAVESFLEGFGGGRGVVYMFGNGRRCMGVEFCSWWEEE